MTAPLKLCKDCRWSEIDSWVSRKDCWHPDVVRRDGVIGKRIPGSCEQLRNNIMGRCEFGELWAPKPRRWWQFWRRK